MFHFAYVLFILYKYLHFQEVLKFVIIIFMLICVYQSRANYVCCFSLLVCCYINSICNCFVPLQLVSGDCFIFNRYLFYHYHILYIIVHKRCQFAIKDKFLRKVHDTDLLALLFNFCPFCFWLFSLTALQRENASANLCWAIGHLSHTQNPECPADLLCLRSSIDLKYFAPF